jgi:predicted DNA-binding protein (MmcQ/YjbR family)
VNAADLRDWCLTMPGAAEEFPFGPLTSVFKVRRKIFAITALDSTPLKVSVKCDPELAEILRGGHEAIVPGYHLNKRHWITVTLGADVPDQAVRDLIEDSYDLVKPKVRQRRSQSGP